MGKWKKIRNDKREKWDAKEKRNKREEEIG